MTKLVEYEGTTVQYWMSKPHWPTQWTLAPPEYADGKWCIVDLDDTQPMFESTNPLETCHLAYEARLFTAEYDRKQGCCPWCLDRLEECECKLKEENQQWLGK